MYFDIKLENVLLPEASKFPEAQRVLLTDFGFARQFDPDNPVMVTEIGCHMSQMAPEFLSKRLGRSGDPHTHAVDIWALGIAFWIMLTCIRRPFKLKEKQRETYDEFLNRMRVLKIREKKRCKKLETRLNHSFGTLLEGMLQPEPARRFKIDDALSHELLKGIGENQFNL